MLLCWREHDFQGSAHPNSAHVWFLFLFVVLICIFEAAFCWDEVFLEAAVYLLNVLASHGDSFSHYLASVLSLFVPLGFLLNLLANFGGEIVPK